MARRKEENRQTQKQISLPQTQTRDGGDPCVVAAYRPPIPPLVCLFSFFLFGMGEEDSWTGSTPARAGFWKDDQGHRWVGGALLLLTRDTTGSRSRGARWNPNSPGGLISV